MGLGWVELSLWSQAGVLAGVEGAGRCFGRELEPSVAGKRVCGAAGTHSPPPLSLDPEEWLV